MLPISDKEALEVLMNSDFPEEIKFEEMREHIFKFRSFYRTLHGNFSRFKDDSAFRENNLKSEIEGLKNQIYNLNVQKAQIEDILIPFTKGKKLSVKERVSGKMDPLKLNTNNENK